jgi:hypothetical protein
MAPRRWYLGGDVTARVIARLTARRTARLNADKASVMSGPMDVDPYAAVWFRRA